jgi:hypothetical protein
MPKHIKQGTKREKELANEGTAGFGFFQEFSSSRADESVDPDDPDKSNIPNHHHAE